MTLTLWRGNHLLGELLARARSAGERQPSRKRPPSLSAFLIPAREAAALNGVWQVAYPQEAGIGVQQFAIEVDIVAERAQRASTQVTNPGPVALKPMSAEEVAGVPLDLQLTVRAADGATHLPLQLRLHEIRYEPAMFEFALREVPREALVDGSVWFVLIDFASDSDAPAV